MKRILLAGMIMIAAALAVLLQLSNALAQDVPQAQGNAPGSTNASLAANYFLARPAGATGGSVSYDLATRKARVILTPGLVSADGEHYYATLPSAGQTVISELSQADGTVLQSFPLAGNWALRAVSADGHWLALVAQPTMDAGTDPDAWEAASSDSAGGWDNATAKTRTEIAVLDTNTGKVAHSLTLGGTFVVEAVNVMGDGLFLIETGGADHPDQYVIRLYDLANDELVAEPLRAKNVTEEVMVGSAWGVVGSANGQFLNTLYLNSAKSQAFVHVLDLVSKFALCVTLPSGDGDMNVLKQYTLALSPDGTQLYAANPALGVVAVVNVPDRAVTQTLHFDPVALTKTQGRGESVVSADKTTVYFTDGENVWRMKVASGQIVKLLNDPKGIVNLGVSADGTQLYVVNADLQLREVDASNGQALAN